MRAAVIAGVFGLFYAYDLWEAVSTLVALPQFYEVYGYGAENVPWWLMWVGVAVPIVIFVLALVIGRGRGLGGKALILLVGLAVVAALSLGIAGVEELLRPALAL